MKVSVADLAAGRNGKLIDPQNIPPDIQEDEITYHLIIVPDMTDQSKFIYSKALPMEWGEVFYNEQMPKAMLN